jgi:hypothetical protein
MTQSVIVILPPCPKDSTGLPDFASTAQRQSPSAKRMRGEIFWASSA